MRGLENPLRSEEAAFRFLLGEAVYLGLIAAGSAIDPWLGLAVFVALTGVLVWRVFLRGPSREPRP